VVQQNRGPFYLATTHATKLDQIGTQSFYGHPDDLSRLGRAVAHYIDSKLPAVEELNAETDQLAQEIAAALLKAKKPLIVSGTSLFSENIVQTASEVAHALHKKEKDSGLIYALPEVNSMGMALQSKQFLEDAFARVEQGNADMVIVLENDLFRRTDAASIKDFFDKAAHSIVLDSLKNPTTALADYVLPAGTFAESNGNVVNNE